MTGPKKIGFWSDLKAVNIGKQRGFLCNGHKYRVIKDFIDYDGTTHNKGEVWTFLAYSFSCYDNGLQWFITFDGAEEWSIPLFLDDMEQQDIDSHPEVYIEVYN
jgi:hypothetical protein